MKRLREMTQQQLLDYLDLTTARRDGPGSDDPTGESWRHHNEEIARINSEINRRKESEVK